MDQFFSGAEFQTFFSKSGQSLIIKANPPYFTMLAVSDRFLEIVNMQRSDIVGKHLFEVFPDNENNPSGKFDTYAVFMRVIETRKQVDMPVYNYEVPNVQTGKAEPIYWANTNEPLLNEEGNVAYIINTTRNITDEILLKKREEKARLDYNNQQQRINDLLMQAPLGMAFLSKGDYVIQYANEAICKMWNKGEPSEVIGISVFDLIPNLEETGLRAVYNQVINTAKPYVSYASPITYDKSGLLETYYFDLHFAPVFDSDNQVSGMLAMANDVTEKISDRKTLQDAEERLRLAIEAGSLGIWDLNLKTGSLVHNPRLAELLGYPTDKQLVHDDVRRNIFPDDVSVVEEAFDEALQGKPFFYEVRVKWPDGTISWIRTLGKAIFDEDNKPSRMLGSVMDITDRVASVQRLDEFNRALQQEIEKFEIVTDFSPQIIWSATADGNIDFVNKGWADFTGLPIKAAYANNWKDIIHPDDFELVQSAWTNSMTSLSGYQVEYRLKKYTGDFYWHLERGKPLLDNKGKVVKWFGATVNINDHIELQKQKDNFLAIASHELKTPVTSIKAYTQILEMMLRNAGDREKADMVGKMDTQINRLTNLIADLLDVTKIHSGKLQFNDVYFDFSKMLDEVIEDLQRTASRHTIVKDYNFTGKIYGDRDRISQVVINLITNAIKYSPNADKIIIHTKHTPDNEVELCVQDFGIGISPDKKDRVFEQFYRVSGSQQHTFPGLGLGLYISSEIIKREGGHIWVNSLEGEGSSFCFALPIDRQIKEN